MKALKNVFIKLCITVLITVCCSITANAAYNGAAMGGC